MQLDRARAISGWMDEVELTWLATRAAACKDMIVEVGAWRGRSTRALADNTTALVYAVDTWDWVEGLNSYWIGKPKEWLMNEFTENTKGLMNVCPTRMSSTTAAKGFKNVDMVFIDADHSYEGVKADITAWEPTVRSGGLLCGHDYTDHDGVRRAVDEMLPGAKVEANSIWAITL